MKKGLIGIAALGMALVAVAGLKGTALDTFAAKLHEAEGVEVSYKMTVVGGATQDYKLSLAKPNKARIETANTVVYADGTTVTTFDKKKNTFYKKAQNDGTLRGLFNDEGLSVWLPFFDVDALDGMASVKDAGTRKRGGKDYKVVDVMADPKGDTKMTLYIDSADEMVKQGEIVVTAAGRSTNTILNASSVKLAAPGADTFAFKAPANSKELKEADLVAGKWYYNWDEAIAAAKASGKIMMVDFYAVWCGPCKLMDKEAFQSDVFKEAAKDLILVKIDAEKDVALAQRYGVEAYPTVKFINGDGNIVHEFVGYGGVNQVVNEVKKASSK